MKCDICLDYYSIPVVMECGHLFCYFCIKNWISDRKKNGECPLCRKFLKSKPILPFNFENLFQRIINTLDFEKKNEFYKRNSSDKKKFSSQKTPFEDWTTYGNLIYDENDCVNRCGSCLVELDSDFCSVCQLHFFKFRHVGIDLRDSSSVDEQTSETNLSFVTNNSSENYELESKYKFKRPNMIETD